MYFVLALILGIPLGISLAAWITLYFVGKSNMLGDSKGEFINFSQAPVNYSRMENSRHISRDAWLKQYGMDGSGTPN